MPTANEIIQDREIRHLIGLQRLTSRQVKQVLDILEATEDDLRRLITTRLTEIAGGRTLSVRETARIQTLLQEIRAQRLAAYRQAGELLSSELQDLGEYEIDFQRRLIEGSAPVELSLATALPIQQVAQIVGSQPFSGLILRDWVADLADGELTRIKRQIQIGMVEGQGIEDIVNRVAGSRSGHIRGVLNISRTHATTWVRSAVSHVAGESRDALFAANTDVIKGVQWLATLDTKTTDLCIARDGHAYSLPEHDPLDGGPPWLAGPGSLHPQCRSSSTPVLKSWKQLGLKRSEVSPGARASMDGRVPGRTTYLQWIKRQSAERQNAVLGVTRGRALRRGDVSVANLFSPDGRLWTLDQLQERDIVDLAS